MVFEEKLIENKWEFVFTMSVDFDKYNSLTQIGARGLFVFMDGNNNVGLYDFEDSAKKESVLVTLDIDGGYQLKRIIKGTGTLVLAKKNYFGNKEDNFFSFLYFNTNSKTYGDPVEVRAPDMSELVDFRSLDFSRINEKITFLVFSEIRKLFFIWEHNQ